MAVQSDPYSTSRTENEFGLPDYPETDRNYTAPNSSGEGGPDAPYIDAFGWAPSLHNGPSGTPDTYRLGNEPLRETKPSPGTNPVQFYQGIDADERQRHSVEFVDADGWVETKDYPGYPAAILGANRWGRNPRETPPAEPRVTSRMAPRSYIFTRPFGTGTAKSGNARFTGIHFSMADHRRTYDILGMEPVRTARNTYRIEPTSWDADRTDMPPVTTEPDREVMAQPVIDVAYQSRNWRLS